MEVAKVATSNENIKIIAMKSLKLNIILISGIALASSCSVYRSGQTPDDVYYSPSREVSSYVQVDNRNDNRYEADAYSAPSEDRYLRMMVRDRARWSVFDDYSYSNNWSYSPFYGSSPYGYSPYGYSYGHPGIGINSYNLGYNSLGYGYNPYGFGMGLGLGGFNSYYNWNSFYNPYYPSAVIINPKTNPEGYTQLRNFNLNNYKNTNYNNQNAGKTYYRGSRGPANTTTNSAGSNGTLGNSVRRIFSGEKPNRANNRNTYYSPSSERPVRNYRPATYNNNSSNNNTRVNSSTIGGSSNSGGRSIVTPGSRPSRR